VAGFAALLTATAVSAQVDGEGAPLRLSVSPGKIELWRDERASLSIDADVPLEAVRLSASAGRIEGVRRVAQNRFVATWIAPDEAYPQVAILTVSGRGGSGWLHGWTRLPLWGLGDAEVKATPNSDITVRIGNRQYGPVRTNARGLARVPVQVAPGDSKAFHGETAIPLNVPIGPRVHVAAPVEAAPGDSEIVVPIRAYVVSADGTPLRSPPLVLEVDRGTVEHTREVEAGVVAATWRIPPAPVGKLQLRARLSGEGARPATLILQVTPGTPARVALSANVEHIAPGGGTVLLAATAFDRNGLPLAAPISFEANVCAPESRQTGEGWTATCVVPSRFGGARTLDVVASAPGADAPVRATLRLPLQSGQPEHVRIEPLATAVKADGTTSVPIRVVVEDRFGNAVPGAPLVVTSGPEEGKLEPLAPGPVEGEFVTRFHAPLSRYDSLATIKLQSGAVHGEGRLTVRGHRGWLSVTPGAWFLSNLRDVNAPLGTAELEVSTPALGGEVAVAAEGGWFNAPVGRAVPPEPQVRGGTTFFTALGSVSYRRDFPFGYAFVGAGGGAGRLTNRLRVDDQPEVVENAWTPAFSVSAGVEWLVWRGGPRLTVRYLWLADPGQSTVMGVLPSISFGVGYRFQLR
jgi:hypothetical protein